METSAGCLPKPKHEWTLIRRDILFTQKIDKNPVFHPQVTKSRNSSTHQENRIRTTPRIQTHPSGVTVRILQKRIVNSFGTNNSGGKVADTSLGRNVTMNKCVQLEGRINKCSRVTIICHTHLKPKKQ